MLINGKKITAKKVLNIRSKTHVFNWLVGICGSLVAFLPTVRDLIPTEYYGPAFIAFSVIGIVLRNVTTTPIEDK